MWSDFANTPASALQFKVPLTPQLKIRLRARFHSPAIRQMGVICLILVGAIIAIMVSKQDAVGRYIWASMYLDVCEVFYV